VEESPTIYSVFLEDSQKEDKSEKDQQPAVKLLSSSVSKKNAQTNKKSVEKPKDKKCTLEDALKQVRSPVSVHFLKILCLHLFIKFMSFMCKS